MANSAKVQFTYNRATLTAINDTITQAVSDVFELDIQPMAVELSPVDTGNNRRSITVQVERIAVDVVKAEIFTQSGYGGYLELGHRVHIGPKGSAQGDPDPADFVQGRPYIYPAFMAHQKDLLEAVKAGLAEMNAAGIRKTVL